MAMSTLLSLFVLLTHIISCTKYTKECNPMDYGAKGDGQTDDTLGIQKAMNDCYLNEDGGNGLVYLPSSLSFLSFPLNASSATNIGFQIQNNAQLIISNDVNKWPIGHNFLSFADITNLEIFGEGLINGQGQIWWKNPNGSRPLTVSISKSVNVLIQNITIKDPPYHCLKIRGSYIELSYVTILAPPSSTNYSNTSTSSHNTDAVDVYGSPFYIHDCYFDTGDDNVAIHSNDTWVENCYFGHGHGASIGSLHGGYYKNISVNNVIFNGTTNGVRIKSWPGATVGKVYDIHFTNLMMYNVVNPIIISQFYENTDNDTIVNETQSFLYFDGIYIENVTSFNSTNAGYFLCQNSTPCRNFVLNNVHIEAWNNNGDFTCMQVFGNATNVSPKSCFMAETT